MTTELERDLAALAGVLRASCVAVRSARGAGSGSGVVWAPGTIVTNAHVARSNVLEIELPDGQRVEGTIARRDERRDLAAVAIDVGAAGLTAARVRDPSDLRTGEMLFAFGHPLGVANVLSAGIAFAPYRAAGDRFVRADLRLAPGNSGGALADAAGRVIGINSMVAGGLALAIPAGDVRRFLGEAMPTVGLGVRLAAVRLPNRRWVHAVLEIEPGSAAERSGLIVGDIIVARDPRSLGRAPSVNIVRGGAALILAIDRPTEAIAAAA